MQEDVSGDEEQLGCISIGSGAYSTDPSELTIFVELFFSCGFSEAYLDKHQRQFLCTS